MPITPESMLGPYRIAGIVGEGGMGVVYRAKDTRLGRDVAIKVLTHVATEDQERLLRLFATDGVMLVRCAVSKPMPVAISSRKLRIIKPAPVSSTSASATSTTIRNCRLRTRAA